MDETSRAIAKAKQAIIDATVETQKKIAFRVNQVVITSTPVDEGTARANWIAGVNNVPSQYMPDSKDPSGVSTIAQNEQVIISAPKEIGYDINISNNAPYIERLNNGWSAQAPVGFVEKAAQIGVVAKK